MTLPDGSTRRFRTERGFLTWLRHEAPAAVVKVALVKPAPSHTTSDGARPARSMPSRLGVPGGALSQLPTGTWQ